MAIFIGVHEIGEHVMSEEQIKGSWEKYKVAAKAHGAEAMKSYLNAEKGRGFCVTEAESAKVVQDAHDDAGVPVKEVIEVQKFQ